MIYVIRYLYNYIKFWTQYVCDWIFKYLYKIIIFKYLYISFYKYLVTNIVFLEYVWKFRLF